MFNNIVNPSKFLSHDDLNELENIQKKKSGDSTFIRILMSKIFVDKNSLKNVSVSGRGKKECPNGSTSYERRKPISPEKLNVLYYLYKKRIENSGADQPSQISRLSLSNINRLIATAKHNLLKANKFTVHEQEEIQTTEETSSPTNHIVEKHSIGKLAFAFQLFFISALFLCFYFLIAQ